MKKWRCGTCGHIHQGEKAPGTCPVCGSPSERFQEYQEAAVQPAVINVLAEPQFNADTVNKISVIKANDVTSDTYYFRPGQVLKYHRHPNGDQVFVILKGQGRFYLDDGTEKTFDVAEGSMILAPAGVWHQLVNTGTGDLIASQVTKINAGMEARA